MHKKQRRSPIILIVIATVIASALLSSPKVLASDPTPATQNVENDKQDLVQLNFPDEVELEALVKFIIYKLNIKILYDESIIGKKVRIRVPGTIPADSLIPVLQNALRIKGFTLTDGDVKGWKQIRKVDNLAALAQPGNAKDVAQLQGAGTPVMQVFMPKNIDLGQAEQIIKPYLSKPGGSLNLVRESGVIIVTDYAGNVIRIAKLIKMLDQPKSGVVTEFVLVQHVDADEVAKQLTSILGAQAQAQGLRQGSEVHISSNARTNQLILTGRQEDLGEAKRLLQSLDIPSSLITKVYSFQNIGAGRIDELISKTLDPDQAKRIYRSTVDPGNNSLVATTTDRIHQRIATLKEQMDVPVPQQRSLLRFYKIKNTSVDEVLKTIQALQQTSSNTNQPNSFGAFGSGAFGRDDSPSPNNQVAGGISLPLRPGESNPPLKVLDAGTGPAMPTSGDDGMIPNLSRKSAYGISGPNTSPFSQHARITADINTNTLIVIAEPEVQKYYEKMIKILDHRSPQVLIEAKVVTLDTTGDFSLGVEVSVGDGLGTKKLFGFSSFGLSTPDPLTGALSLTPGVGFNGTLVDPGTADVIVRAMSNHARAKVVASPRILVNDNIEGRLQSVVSIPYQSVNASQTVATSSLGGNQDAGTMISVTPHIGDDDHLQLDFSIQFSSFGEGGNDALPPPRHIDQIDSTVTIPDGYTVIVGGLNRSDHSNSVSGLPGLENVPVLRYLVSLQSSSSKNTSLFVFIRPIILRKDKFEDLKFLSDRDVHSAQIPSRFPTSSPLIMR